MEINLKKLRTMKYFIDATQQIIDTEGIEKATIRNIAEKAGYNSATIYNYFNDLEHLIFFTKISHLERYTKRLLEELSDDMYPIHEFLSIWQIFANEAFKNPQTFYDLFFSKYSLELSDSLQIYYRIYPDKLNASNHRLKAMLNESDIYKRNMTLMNECIEKGCFVKEDEVEEINELMIITFRGLLNRYIETESTDIEQYTEKYMQYLDILLRLELPDGKDTEIATK